MPLIRALTDIRIKSMSVPLNRVANVDQETMEEITELLLATSDPRHIQTALTMNPEVVDVCGGYVADVEEGNKNIVQQVETVKQPDETVEQPVETATKTTKK
jgi:hypothetical protein